MLKLLMDFPEQCEYAYKLACDFKLPKKLSRISSVIVTGLGGSAIGGDLLKAYLNSETKIPIVVNRNYILPSWVNKKHTYICSELFRKY